MGFTPEQWNELVESLQKYAQLLKQTFEHNLAAINGPGMGIRLEAKLRCSLQIDPHGAVRDRAAQMDRDEQTTGPHDPLQRSMDDMMFFETWLNQPAQQAKRLLLLGPFGSGKSVMLAKFALVLAQRLEEWCIRDAMPPPPPIVPFPVRLRGWGGKGLAWDYMLGDAQKDVLGRRILSAEKIQRLREHGLLLPILDGFDELPNDTIVLGDAAKNARAALIDEMLATPVFGNGIILASRPEHGAEYSPYVEDATIHKLGELDPEKAEEFITDRLAKLTPPVLANFMQRYRDAQPAINDLFRRPLFLAAWCSKAAAARTAQEIPTTISGLMGAMLEHVLDVRLADYQSGSAKYLPQSDLLRSRHLLGAVLAIHADHGFGAQLPTLIEKQRESIHGNLFADESTFDLYVQAAVRAGLLLKNAEHTYTHKIPIVEYLIGSYYAWLAKPDSPKDQSRPMRLAQLFQKRFWWRDHNEVWLYAFDMMWHGDLSQRQTATGIVQWVLALSAKCLESTSAADSFDPDNQESLPEPFSYWRFVLRFLLPTSDASRPADVARLTEELRKQFVIEAVFYWRIQNKPLVGLNEVAQRFPVLINQWLRDCLGNPELCREWPHIAATIDGIAEYIDEPTARELLDCFDNPQYQHAWDQIASLLVHCTTHMGLDDIKRLLSILKDAQRKDVREIVANVIGKASATLGTSATQWLLSCLGASDYLHVRSEIVECLNDAYMHLDEGELASLMRIMRDYVPPSEEPRAAPPAAEERISLTAPPTGEENPRKLGMEIARLVGIAVARNGEEAFEHLLACLSQSDYQAQRQLVGHAIFVASSRLRRTGFDRLVTALKDDYDFEASAILESATVEAARRMDRCDVKRLIECLTDEAYNHRWYWIAGAIRGVLAPTVHRATAPPSRQSMIPHESRGSIEDFFDGILKDFVHVIVPNRHIAPEKYAAAFGHALEFLFAAVNLGNGEYVRSSIERIDRSHVVVREVKGLAQAEASSGRTSRAMRMTRLSTALIFFVRSVELDANGACRIVYGVAERHDADLLLNLRYAPDWIQQLLVEEQPPPDPVKGHAILWVFVEAIAKSKDVYLAAAFAYHFRNLATFSKFLHGDEARQGFRQLLNDDQNKQIVLSGKGTDARGRNRTLTIDRTALRKALADSQELMSKVLEISHVKDCEIPVRAENISIPVFVCRTCFAIHDSAKNHDERLKFQQLFDANSKLQLAEKFSETIKLLMPFSDKQIIFRPKACKFCTTQFTSKDAAHDKDRCVIRSCKGCSTRYCLRLPHESKADRVLKCRNSDCKSFNIVL